jgi:rubrerythrin
VSAGKGDTPRPVAGDKFRANYDAIFNRGKPYPVWICRPCGFAHGRFPGQDRVSTYHEDTCGICGEETACTEPRDFGYLRQWPL